MKWLLLSAVTLMFPMYASTPACKTPKCPKEECIIDPCDENLFKKCDQVFSTHAEFLYWTIAEGGLDYALKMRHNAWGPNQVYAQGRVENGSYGFDPGVRVALVYFRAPHYWESKWQYTRMTSRGDTESGKPDASEQFLTGTWPQVMNQPLAGAKTHLHLNYNVFEWLIDRVFFPNPHLRLRLWGGALAAWMDQEWKIQYFDSTPNSTTITNRWRFVGAGLKTGTLVDWYWTGNLYMTGSAMFSSLIGAYSNHSKQMTSFQPSSEYNTAVPLRDVSFHDTRPAFTTQFLFGPSWQKNYTKSRVEVFAGFEMNTWFNLQEVFRSTSGTPSTAKESWIATGVMTLYGLTTRLSVDF